MSVFYPLVRPEQVEAADRELAIALHLAGNDVDLNALTTRDRDEIAAARRPSQDGETRPVIGIVWILAVAGYVSALFAPMPPTVVPAVALVLIAVLWWSGPAGGRDVRSEERRVGKEGGSRCRSWWG